MTMVVAMVDEIPEKRFQLVHKSHGNGHAITPKYRTIHEADGTPATGLIPQTYPLWAICLECEKVITIRRYIGEWIHLEG
jgi:hypothetical protein